MKLPLILLFCSCASLMGTDKNELQQLHVEATKFFESFSRALEKQESTQAAMHIAPKYRARFSKGYQFWRGTKLSVLKVNGLPDKEGVLRVKTQILSPSGRKDTEIKKLLRSKDKWFLLES